jgi:hypothetical protein
MSGGKEKKQTNEMITEDRAYNKKTQDQFEGQLSSRSDTSYGRNTQTYNDLYGGYSNLAKGMNATGGGMGSSGSSGGGGPSFGSGTKYGDVESMYREFMGKSGGLDPDRVATMDNILGKYTPHTQFGAGSAEDAARLRGGGVYDEMARTGGINDVGARDIRQRAALTGSSVYKNLGSDINRMASAAGGGGPAMAAAASRMARQGSQAAGQNALGADIDIESQRRQGKLAGAQGMSTTEQAIQDNIQRALGSQFAGNQGLAEQIRGGRQWGTQGLEGVAQAEGAASAASAANASADERYRNQMMMAGLGGLMDLRGQETGMESGYDQQRLGSRGVWGQNAAGGINQRIQNNPQKSFLDYLQPAMGAASSVLGGMGGGGGGMNWQTPEGGVKGNTGWGGQSFGGKTESPYGGFGNMGGGFDWNTPEGGVPGQVGWSGGYGRQTEEPYGGLGLG